MQGNFCKGNAQVVANLSPWSAAGVGRCKAVTLAGAMWMAVAHTLKHVEQRRQPQGMASIDSSSNALDTRSSRMRVLGALLHGMLKLGRLHSSPAC